jgi:hypothetical protein
LRDAARYPGREALYQIEWPMQVNARQKKARTAKKLNIS